MTLELAALYADAGDVDVLIIANPCFGLDFASVAEIRAQIIQRNRGATVLLVSEDLDEMLRASAKPIAPPSASTWLAIAVGWSFARQRH